jgi:hypothetical protein
MLHWNIRLSRGWVLGGLLLLAFPAWPQTPAPAAATGTPAAAAAPAGSTPASAAPNAAGSNNPAPADAAARNPAAKVNLVDGQVRIVGPDKVSRAGSVGDQLYEGDAIVTGDNAEIHLDMADGGFIAVRPNSQIRIAKYQANGDESDVSVIGLLKGSLRSITGWIGKSYPRKYAVVTPSATIGVRGTDHEPAYVPEGTPGVDAGTYDNVHAGSTTIANSHGTIEVTPGRAGFVDHRGLSQPRVLEKVPEFFSVPRRHDAVFVGKQERVAASLEQRRTERVQQHQREVKSGGAGARGANGAQRESKEPVRPAARTPAATQAAGRGQPAAQQTLRERMQQNTGNKPAAESRPAPAQQGFLQRLMHPQAPAAAPARPGVPAKPVPRVDPKKKVTP